MAKNHYETLGVNKNASQDEIKSAYRKLARQYHPDLHPNDEECARKFKELNEANEILSDPQKRSQYDYELEHPGASSFGGGAGGFSGFGGFGDIFDDIMGSMFGGRGQASQTPKVGDNVQLEVELSFLDAVKGCRKEIKYSRKEPCKACRSKGSKNGTEHTTCPDCHGSGNVQYASSNGFFRTINTRLCGKCSGKGFIIKEKCPECYGKGYKDSKATVVFDIPAGADTGSYMRKKGYGHASTKGGEPGDLIVAFRVAPHKLLQRKNFDLFVEVPIDYKTAVLGGKIKVPGIDDVIEIDIPEGTSHGTQFRIRGKGVAKQRDVGDLYVSVVIDIPKRLSKNQRQMVEEFSEDIELKQCDQMKKYYDNVRSLYGKEPYKKD